MNDITQPVIAVFDKKAGLFDNPFCVRHIADAIREWDVIRKDTTHKYGKNPEDFDLIHIGTYNFSTAQTTNLQPHQPLSSGV